MENVHQITIPVKKCPNEPKVKLRASTKITVERTLGKTKATQAKNGVRKMCIAFTFIDLYGQGLMFSLNLPREPFCYLHGLGQRVVTRNTSQAQTPTCEPCASFTFAR